MRRLAVGLVAVTLGVAGCGIDTQEHKGLGDAPTGEKHEEPREVILMPDTFPNLAVVCDGGTRVYVNTRNAGNMAAVPNSPECRG